jgi:metal-responsive CopG/Arc/MetJ family transcriptional regulator
MGEKLVNISVNVPNIYLKDLERLLALGKVKSKSQFVRDAIEHYLNLDIKLIDIFKTRKRIR